MAAAPADAPQEIAAALVRMSLLQPGSAAPPMTALTGGVSSDIWRVDLPGRTICVKRALPQLKVAAEWIVPVERSEHEWDWYRLVDETLPGACPHPIARDEASNLFAMDFLPPRAVPAVEGAAPRRPRRSRGRKRPSGHVLGRIHATTAGNADIAARFPPTRSSTRFASSPISKPPRACIPNAPTAILAAEATTASTRRVLVHGDVSPKNILVGPHGPVILDAECAWYGDPAFDLAFCLNHLLLKTLARPDRRDALAASFTALVHTYAGEIDWEPAAAVLARTARLLPALFLARVDGKSPVEYLREEAQRERVRVAAVRWLDAPVDHPDALARRLARARIAAHRKRSAGHARTAC